MLRILVLLLVVGGLTLFLLSNPTPIPLVILGVRTAAVPLAVWIMGAIGAGALTTLFLAGILQVSNFFAAPRRARGARGRGDRRGASEQSWNGEWTPQEPEPVDSAPYTAYTAATAETVRDDDWSRAGRNPDEWEDWTGYSEPAATAPDAAPFYEPPYYDGEPDSTPPDASPPYSDSYSGYPDSGYPDRRTVIQDQDASDPDSEEWDDWEYDEDADRRYDREIDPDEDDRPRPVRTEFELKQEPKSTYRSGSIYSYSYRNTEESGAGKAESVYDADYRVIRPAQPPDGETSEPEFATSDAEDWDFEEDEFEEDEFEEDEFEEDEFESDRPRQDRPR